MLLKVHQRRDDDGRDDLAPATGCFIWTLVLLALYLLATAIGIAIYER